MSWCTTAVKSTYIFFEIVTCRPLSVEHPPPCLVATYPLLQQVTFWCSSLIFGMVCVNATRITVAADYD